METVTVRDLRNHGADVLDQVSRGQEFVVTRDGRPVAELRPVRGRSLPTADLIGRRAALPRVDPDAMRSDIDEHLDPSL